MLDSSARRLCALVVLGLLATGCTEERKSEPQAAPTPITSLNTAAMQVPRIEFCGLVPHSAVTDALGGKAESDASYRNGDEVQLAGVGNDVVHEIGCTWSGKDDVNARAWVFARPVSAAFARTVVASARETKGCRAVPGPSYGSPTVTQLCRLADGAQRVRHAGLFGQTWLTCEVAASGVTAADLRTRTDRWCVQVVNALNTAG